ncbi:hypothetical protein A1O1_06832 [Capronia coronata CBS 617.96]|uniref:Smr domain-containing protein n=1 Tax=Capronia coronata CBS 617.96 TaxID=1182541 RepID=W9XSK1_9EURO|nr:uncharacterized protein A1O1_06832 [Capronia coronata CBS 617.96]EXJ83213.1 hypothetical protein A1O1_06832 [Capronia coronata CBS 617.96]
MSYEMSTRHATRIGTKPFNHSQSEAAEREYDRLRDLARQEAAKRASCSARSQEAYQRGDGAAAHALSEEAKAHGRKMEEYNRQASEFIFRENNAPGRVPADTIDLHGQFVEEAEDILEERIRYARAHGDKHLHVIVGKGNHSTGHVQKLKPRVEQVCQELGLQYRTEPNEGRIYVDLTGGAVDMQNANNWAGYQSQQQPQTYSGMAGHQQQQGYGHQQSYQQHPSRPHQQQQHQQGHGQGQTDQVEKLVKKFLPRLIDRLLRWLCH